MNTRPRRPARLRCRTIALAACLLSGCAAEQLLIGQWYGIRTPSAGGCPALDWHFVVSPRRSIEGFLAGDSGQRIATLAGDLNPDDSFRIAATRPGGAPASTVSGRFSSGISTIAIHGDAAGAACDGQTFDLRLTRYLARQGGGGGGGG